ncbi:MAG: hypothetical protein WDA09_11605 [Bacteriovoracaceae bacterium]
MTQWQGFLLVFMALYSLIAAIKGYSQTKIKNNPYGLAPWFNLLSIYVWADAVIFGVFFFLISVAALFLRDFILFLLIFSLFWTVRSIGESIYWFLEQFAVNHRNPEHTLWLSRWFPRNSSWIANQILHQCITVIGIIASVYLFKLWLI